MTKRPNLAPVRGMLYLLATGANILDAGARRVALNPKPETDRGQVHTLPCFPQSLHQSSVEFQAAKSLLVSELCRISGCEISGGVRALSNFRLRNQWWCQGFVEFQAAKSSAVYGSRLCTTVQVSLLKFRLLSIQCLCTSQGFGIDGRTRYRNERDVQGGMTRSPGGGQRVSGQSASYRGVPARAQLPRRSPASQQASEPAEAVLSGLGFRVCSSPVSFFLPNLFYTHTHIHILSLSLSLTHTLTYTYTYTHTHIHTHTHTHNQQIKQNN
jgi:hypothetical protein